MTQFIWGLRHLGDETFGVMDSDAWQQGRAQKETYSRTGRSGLDFAWPLVLSLAAHSRGHHWGACQKWRPSDPPRPTASETDVCQIPRARQAHGSLWSAVPDHGLARGNHFIYRCVFSCSGGLGWGRTGRKLWKQGRSRTSLTSTQRNNCICPQPCSTNAVLNTPNHQQLCSVTDLTEFP